MRTKSYWLMSDNKTVREVSDEEYKKLVWGKRNVKVAVAFKNELMLAQTYKDIDNSMRWKTSWIHRRQLDQIWRTEPCSSE